MPSPVDAKIRKQVAADAALIDVVLEEFKVHVEQGAYLEALDCLRRIAGRRDLMIQVVVQGARARGATWQDVGDALGLHRSSAQQRFGASPQDPKS